jgi:hypothetical protein
MDDDWLRNWLHGLGIPPLYFGTLVMLIASLFETRNIKNWDKLPNYKKRFIIMTWITALGGLFWSIIAFFRIHL